MLSFFYLLSFFCKRFFSLTYFSQFGRRPTKKTNLSQHLRSVLMELVEWEITRGMKIMSKFIFLFPQISFSVKKPTQPGQLINSFWLYIIKNEFLKYLAIFSQKWYSITLLATLIDKIIISNQWIKIFQNSRIFFSRAKKSLNSIILYFSENALKNEKWKTENYFGTLENGKQRVKLWLD